MNAFPEELRREMDARGLNIEMVAEVCEVSTGCVERWLSGASDPLKVAQEYALERVRSLSGGSR